MCVSGLVRPASQDAQENLILLSSEARPALRQLLLTKYIRNVHLG